MKNWIVAKVLSNQGFSLNLWSINKGSTVYCSINQSNDPSIQSFRVPSMPFFSKFLTLPFGHNSVLFLMAFRTLLLITSSMKSSVNNKGNQIISFLIDFRKGSKVKYVQKQLKIFYESKHYLENAKNWKRIAH